MKKGGAARTRPKNLASETAARVRGKYALDNPKKSALINNRPIGKKYPAAKFPPMIGENPRRADISQTDYDYLKNTQFNRQVYPHKQISRHNLQDPNTMIYNSNRVPDETNKVYNIYNKQLNTIRNKVLQAKKNQFNANTARPAGSPAPTRINDPTLGSPITGQQSFVNSLLGAAKRNVPLFPGTNITPGKLTNTDPMVSNTYSMMLNDVFNPETANVFRRF